MRALYVKMASSMVKPQLGPVTALMMGTLLSPLDFASLLWGGEGEGVQPIESEPHDFDVICHRNRFPLIKDGEERLLPIQGSEESNLGFRGTDGESLTPSPLEKRTRSLLSAASMTLWSRSDLPIVKSSAKDDLEPETSGKFEVKWLKRAGDRTEP